MLSTPTLFPAIRKADCGQPVPSVGVTVPLGVFPLRGVVDPPKLLEVKPTCLLGRRFPPLRVERANVGSKMEPRASSEAPVVDARCCRRWKRAAIFLEKNVTLIQNGIYEQPAICLWS